MSRIDKAIIDIENVIFQNIELITEDSGLLAQNILAQLRKLVEHIAMKICVIDLNMEDEVAYDNIEKAVRHIRSQVKYIN